MLQSSEDEIENVSKANEHLLGESITPGHLVQTRLPSGLLQSSSNGSAFLIQQSTILTGDFE